jgi:hypothetical protein
MTKLVFYDGAQQRLVAARSLLHTRGARLRPIRRGPETWRAVPAAAGEIATRFENLVAERQGSRGRASAYRGIPSSGIGSHVAA